MVSIFAFYRCSRLHRPGWLSIPFLISPQPLLYSERSLAIFRFFSFAVRGSRLILLFSIHGVFSFFSALSVFICFAVLTFSRYIVGANFFVIFPSRFPLGRNFGSFYAFSTFSVFRFFAPRRASHFFVLLAYFFAFFVRFL